MDKAASRSLDARALVGRPMPMRAKRQMAAGYAMGSACIAAPAPSTTWNTESYSTIVENGFRKALDSPLSTFSIDVDAASYSNVRRFLTGNSLPPKDAVRIEELVNYFHYDYPRPDGDDPFSITTELGPCPWEPKHRIVHIGLQGVDIDTDELPPSNLVFLLDVSGSMNAANKLPLLKSAMKMLVNRLDKDDRVAIVVYAGAAGLVLPSTSGADKSTIIDALNRLNAGGSTAGGAGIKLAYEVAREHYLAKGNNRVILCTDGDFNVGASSDAAMVRLIEEKRKDGVFLTVLGFGTGNYKDSKMEQLADKGNGNYAYIDNLLEAKKVLVTEMGATLVTIAKDVKIQVEFNPAAVEAYRLIGYENRALKNEDFNDDTKDAGELGAGHSVTALYEIVPAGTQSDRGGGVDPLKYQTRAVKKLSDELLTVKFRYKAADGDTSRLIVQALADEPRDELSENFRFSAAVAGFGMLLRESAHGGSLTWDQVLEMARDARGRDREGYRAEFVRLVERAQLLAADRRS
ncbi:MAG: DUF3520 domain-containing protein [Chitinivibrionales bacterium]|nr:DUF3520 domain-containing protein [Chitinivibrionales bacterium]